MTPILKEFWKLQSSAQATRIGISLFSAVALMFAQLHRKYLAPARSRRGYAKPEPTFTDTLAAVRQELGSGFLHPPRLSPKRGKIHHRQSSIRCWTASATLPEVQKGKSRTINPCDK